MASVDFSLLVTNSTLIAVFHLKSVTITGCTSVQNHFLVIFWIFNIVPQPFEQRHIFISVAKDLLISSSKLNENTVKVF